MVLMGSPIVDKFEYLTISPKFARSSSPTQETNRQTGVLGSYSQKRKLLITQMMIHSQINYIVHNSLVYPLPITATYLYHSQISKKLKRKTYTFFFILVNAVLRFKSVLPSAHLLLLLLSNILYSYALLPP